MTRMMFEASSASMSSLYLSARIKHASALRNCGVGCAESVAQSRLRRVGCAESVARDGLRVVVCAWWFARGFITVCMYKS